MTSRVTIIRAVGGLVFDATFEEDHESELEITDNPVETGVVVSDHAYMRPLEITISAGVTDTPLATRPNDPFASDASRSQRAFDLLTQLQASREPFDVQTGLKLYRNMLVRRIRTAQDAATSQVFVFTAELREVKIVSTRTVTFTARKGSTHRQASKTKNKGEVQGKEVTTAKKSSALVKLGRALGIGQ